MMNEKKKQVKKSLAKLREDEKSVLYANENVTNTLVKKLRKSTHPKDRTLLSLCLKLKNEKPDEKYTDKSEEVFIPIYTAYTDE